MEKINPKEWNDRFLVKIHKNFYANLGELFREIDEFLFQQCKVAYDSIEKQDEDAFNHSADLIKAIVQEKEFRKRVGRHLALKFGNLYRKYRGELAKHRKEKRAERWEGFKKKFGL